MKIIIGHDIPAGAYEIDASSISTSAIPTIAGAAFMLDIRVEQPKPPRDETPADPHEGVPPSVDIPPATALPVAVITGTFADGTEVDMTVGPGQRAMLVPDDFSRGSVMYYDDGAICFENAYVGTQNATPTDFNGAFSVAVGGQAFHTGNIVLCYRCCTRPFWVIPPIARGHDPALFPKYGSGSEGATRVASYAAADNSITGQGLASVNENDPGMRDEIALLPGWDVCAIVNPSIEADAVVRGMGDSVAVWPIHAIDCATNKRLIPSDYPRTSDYPAFRGIAGNPFQKYTTACKLVTNSSHAPAFSALAASMFGTSFDRAMLGNWATYICRLCYNYTYVVSPTGPGWTNQTRGIAWELRTLAQAARLSDEPEFFADWMRQLIAYATAKYKAQTGLAIDQQADSTGYKNHGYAPWQMHYLVSALGYVIQLGFTEAQWLLDYFGGPVLDSMDKTQHELATTYNACMRHADGTLVQDWAAALEAREEYTTPGTGGQFGPAAARQNAAAEDSDEMQLALYGVPTGSPVPAPYRAGDMAGYPVSDSGLGYPAILRTALAALADHATDKARAQAVWAKFLKYDRTSYATGPSCNVVP